MVARMLPLLLIRLRVWLTGEPQTAFPGVSGSPGLGQAPSPTPGSAGAEQEKRQLAPKRRGRDGPGPPILVPPPILPADITQAARLGGNKGEAGLGITCYWVSRKHFEEWGRNIAP